MSRRFLADDEVRCQQRGPVMIVKGYDHNGQVMCTWHTRQEGWQEEAFKEGSLQLYRRIKDLARFRPVAALQV